MKNKKENEFLGIRIIITTITLIIATLLIWLFGIVVANAETQYSAETITMYSSNNYTNQVFSGTPSNAYNFSYQYIKSIKGNFFNSNGAILEQNKTYKITFIMDAITTMPQASGLTQFVNPIMKVNVNGNWIQATPDRFENEQLTRPSDAPVLHYGWSFELDSTIWTNNIEISVSFTYGSFTRLQLFNLLINDTSGANDTQRIIDSVNSQTDSINNNNNNNTNKMIDKWEELFTTEGNKENQNYNQTNGDIDNIETRENTIENIFNQNSRQYRINYNNTAYELIWVIMERIINLHTYIYTILLSVLSIAIIKQAWGR